MSESAEQKGAGEEKKEVFTDLRNPDVVTKYKMAAEICNAALANVVKACVADAVIRDVCAAGDKEITDKCEPIFKKKDIKKGVAFPTCVSVNNIVGHFAPNSVEDKTALKAGDVVKVDMGVHIDGFCATAATTLVVGDGKVTGTKANVILAAYNAAEAAMRMVADGNKNTPITKAIHSIAKDYGCNPVQGVLSHNMTQHTIDGPKVITNRDESDQKVSECDFATNEVYHVDVVVSSGEGKPMATDVKTTVYKRVPDATYALKRPQSRQVFTDIKTNLDNFPFHVRVLDQKIAAYGLIELRENGLISALPVLREKDDQFVAQFKFTMLLMNAGPVRLVSYPALDVSKFETDKKITDQDLATLVAKPWADPAKKDKKKK